MSNPKIQQRGIKPVIIEAIAFPLGVIAAFLILMVVWRVAAFPTPEETFSLIMDFFEEYGQWLVLLGSIGEGIAVLNFYVPGSAVVLLGVIAQRGDPLGALEVVAVASVGFFLAANVNYLLGKLGMYPILHRLGGRKFLERSRHKYAERGTRALALGYFHPNIGGLIAVAAGIAQLPWNSFIFVVGISIAFWNLIWGAAVYLVAGPVEEVATSPFLVLGALVVWLTTSLVLAVLRFRRIGVAKD